MRSVSEQLRAQQKEGPAKIADQAAERTERLGSYLRESDADRILADIEEAARRRPGLVIAGGIALGFVAARFLKASSSERYRTSISTRPAEYWARQPARRPRGNGYSENPVGSVGITG